MSEDQNNERFKRGDLVKTRGGPAGLSPQLRDSIGIVTRAHYQPEYMPGERFNKNEPSLIEVWMPRLQDWAYFGHFQLEQIYTIYNGGPDEE